NGTFANGSDFHQRVALQARVIADALRTVRAVLGARSCLDRKESAHLDCVRLMVSAVHALSLVHQVEERQRKQLFDLGERPVVADRGSGMHAWETCHRLLWMGCSGPPPGMST